ncbi:hypothetical protein BD779DRAFT_1475627 [Infundibulicybe gibba]|nr:hypothetical protein BD779DRAFT_1475627 [Infundibulicybe gibba]
MAALADNNPHSFQHSSPLDTLIRRTSSRRKPRTPVTPSPHDQVPHTLDGPRRTPPRAERPYESESDQLHPSSPLLHSRFARDSVATASSKDNNSYLDTTRASIDSRNVYQEIGYNYYDDESIYSDNTDLPALRDSWQSGNTVNAVYPHHIGNLGNTQDPLNNSPNVVGPLNVQKVSSPMSSSRLAIVPAVPTVVVSSHDADEPPYRAGRAPIVKPVTSNFSRPVRAQPDLTTPPNLEEQKRRVLERNAHRTPSPNSQDRLPYQSKRPNAQLSHSPPHQQDRAGNARVLQPSQPARGPVLPRNPSPSPSPSQQGQSSVIPSTRSLGPSTNSPSYASLSTSPQSSMFSNRMLDGSQTSNTITLPNRPPSMSSGSPVSLYSNYSYYPLDTPTDGEFRPQQTPREAPRSHQQSPQPRRSPSPRSIAEASAPETPQAFLQLGITHHEANRLKESAICFEKSATNNGGCGVGMLMWGLAQRHGWGCEKNEKSGFKWLRRAAESAVDDLEHARGAKGVDSKAVQKELVLAIYEVGQCFFQGWGVTKDQKMAVSYYTVAARLGDPDAQSDLAFCLANGKGCKKDRKEAAKWYRAAVAQGQSDIGLAWIYKEKYQ